MAFSRAQVIVGDYYGSWNSFLGFQIFWNKYKLNFLNQKIRKYMTSPVSDQVSKNIIYIFFPQEYMFLY